MLSFALLALSGGALAQDEDPIIEWEKRQNVDERLRAYGTDLLGDGIDPHTGAVSFQHTDVELPGNTHLEVAIRRKIFQGEFYHMSEAVEFGDWRLDVPRIHTLHGDNGFVGNRCSNDFATVFPPEIGFSPTNLLKHEYSEGLILEAPGGQSIQLLEVSPFNTLGPQWPSTASHISTEGWWFECTSASDGGEGFKAHAPNGDVYTLDKVIVREGNPLGGWASSLVYRKRTIIAATRVTDVNGNYVDYTYDGSGRLTRIKGNDGRRIDVNYAGANEYISSVTANGRTWSYSYSSSSFSNPSYIGDYGGGPRLTLDSVTRPDGRSWTFDLDAMQARPGPGALCIQPVRSIAVTHPMGVSGVFELREQKHRTGNLALIVEPNVCPSEVGQIQGGIPLLRINYFESMAVTKKSLSPPGLPTSEWRFNYEGEFGQQVGLIDPTTPEFCADVAADPASECTNWTKVQEPDGRHITYYHFWNAEKFGGKLARREVRETDQNGPLLETRTLEYVLEGAVGISHAAAGPSPRTILAPGRESHITVNRGGDVYNVEYTYNLDQSSSSYSYGFPTKVEQWSNLQSGTRVTDMSYAHNETKWVLGLPDTVIRNGKLFDDYIYDSLGRLIDHDKFGANYKAYAYHNSPSQAAGRVARVTDAQNRIWRLTSYKRGHPQLVTRPDNVQLTSTVDNNGWLTSATNARGFTTGYTYNNFGWITGIDRPTPFADSAITYNAPLGGVAAEGSVLRVIHIRGTHDLTTNYDGFLRPMIVKSAAASGGGTTGYVRTRYDGLGRTIFTSFQGASWNSVDGVETTYDALGRVTQTRESVSPYATTTYEYLSDNRMRVTDPMNAQTTTKSSGYGSPDDGNVIQIIDPLNASTDMKYDIYGNITQFAQAGTQNGYTASVTRNFWYDTRLRLCRHATPEMGDELFAYDSLDRLQYSSRGENTGASCATPSSSLRTAFTYDALNRVTLVNFPSGTADIATTYDPNGNETKVTRGGTVWDYNYDALDQITMEKLAIDGRIYQFDYTRNANGYVTSRTTPTGASFSFAPDGLGRPTGVSFAGTDYISGVTYHPNGMVASGAYGNGHQLTQSLTARQQIYEIKTEKPGGPLAQHLRYAYDARSKITSTLNFADPGHDRTYAYDAKGRLIDADGSWGQGSYKYDALDNIRQKKLGARTVDIAYNADNLVSQVTDTDNPTRNFIYDARGNTIDNGPFSFVYDHANQPVSASGAGVSDSYVFDGNFKRVKYVTDQGGKVFYDIYSRVTGKLILRDNVAGDRMWEFDHIGPMMSWANNGAPGAYRLKDHLGTLTGTVLSSGAVHARKYVTPFGEEIGGDWNLQLFTGHLRDAATDLNYMQARFYDPVIGRFLATDPIGYQDQFNLYAYVGNDPVNMTDPTGEFGIAGAIYGAISGGVGGYIASGGNLKATAAGAAVGAAVGAVNPFASNVVGAAAGSAVASAAGQVVGGVVDGQSVVDAVANVDKAAVAGAAVGGAAGRAVGAVAGNATAPVRGSVIGAEVGRQTVSRAPGNVVGSVIEGSAAGAGELAGPHVADAIQDGGTAFFEGVDDAIATEMEHNQQRYDDPER